MFDDKNPMAFKCAVSKIMLAVISSGLSLKIDFRGNCVLAVDKLW